MIISHLFPPSLLQLTLRSLRKPQTAHLNFRKSLDG